MEFKLKRKFAMTMYKNLKFKLSEMSFAKDFVNDTRGNLYPILEKSKDCVECVERNYYKLNNGHIKRMVCQFFPYATYELTAGLIRGEVGFCFKLPNCEASVFISGNKLVYMCGRCFEQKDLPDYLNEEFTLIVSCRPNAFDIYFKNNNKAEFFCTFVEEKFENSHKYSVFSNGYAALYGSGNMIVKDVVSYIDNGISTADMRPIRYETGEIMI